MTTNLPFLKDRDVALLGSDSAQDVGVVPGCKSTAPSPTMCWLPVHKFALVARGMNLFDNLDLEALAATAARLKRWEFMLTAAPIRVPGGTGTPINPIAVFKSCESVTRNPGFGVGDTAAGRADLAEDRPSRVIQWSTSTGLYGGSEENRNPGCTAGMLRTGTTLSTTISGAGLPGSVRALGSFATSSSARSAAAVASSASTTRATRKATRWSSPSTEIQSPRPFNVTSKIDFIPRPRWPSAEQCSP